MNARAIVAFAILAVLRMGTAMSQVADETVGDFRVVVNERYESSVSYQGKAVVTRDASGLATPDWKTIFPSQAAKRNLARVDAPEGRQIVITCDDPAIGNSHKVITLTPRYVDYHLEFNVKPGVEKAHQSQWFVVLAAVEGGDYSVTTLTERKDGVFRSARGPTTLVNGARFATVPTAAGPMAFDFGDSDMGWHLDDYTNFWAKTYIFYNSKDLDPKLGCRRRVSFRIHPGSHEPPKPRFEPLSIAAASTTGFTDEKAGDRQGGWTDDGPNDMRQFPVGEQTFRGVPFSIVDPAKNGGRSCIALRGQAWKGYPPRDYFPESASIAVGKKATTLYFLQTCAWPATAGQSAARYVLRYEDGSTAETPLVCGYDLCDWFNIKDADRCFVAWVSLARGGASYGVHVAWWRNPFPDKKIESLTFRSENTSAVPILLAVTLSDQEPRIFGEPVDASLDKTDVSTWFPFTFPWCEAEPGTATDVSFLLDPPAGKHGFVMARDGHFFFQNGKRAKFWGVNLDRVPCFPHRENADRIAAHLAKYGNNIVRLHCLESFQPTKENIFDQSHDDSLHLSPENMERLDYFLAQLKKRGIYVVIDLWGFRKFLPGDGVKDREAWQGRQVTSMQGAVIFNERLQELEREYARLLLTHVNPHTGLALKDDPQLALIELFNEVSLLVRWTWSAMPPSYVQELTEMWNTWLVGMYRSRDGLAQAWTNADGKCFLQAEEDPSKGTVRPFFDLYALGAPKDAPEDRLGDARVNDAIRFLYELEVKHSRMMRDHLRSLGVKVPIASTGALGETAPSAAAAATLDFIDQHTYWHHPSYPEGRTRLYSAGETEVSPFVTPVNDARSECHMNNVMRTAAVKAAGLPLVNSEWNIPWPNEHRMAGPLFIAAYACLQDWDGILLYAPRPIKTLAESPEAERCDTAIAVFDPMFDPSRMATWQAAGTMFLRGDVQAANKLVTIVHGENDPFFARTAAIEPHRQPHGARYAPFRFLPFVSRVESCWSGLATPRRSDLSLQARLDAPRDPNADPQWLLRVVQESARAQRVWPEHVMRQDVLSSDTGQLAWAYGDGYFTADAPLSQAAVGRIGGQDIRLSALSVGATTERCAVSATSLDGKPLSASARILLCAGARAQNTDLRLQRLGQWLTVLRGGKAPVLAEPVKAQVSLQRDGAAPKLRAWALAPSGQRVQELGIQSGPQAASLEIGTRAVSIYYELAAK